MQTMTSNTPTLTSYEESVAPWNDTLEELYSNEDDEEWNTENT